MKENINIRRLADVIAAKASADGRTVTPEEVAEFLKVLFDTVGDTLLRGDSVEVDGLGAFIVDYSSQYGIELLVDRGFAQTVNEPFDSFEATELDDEITNDLLDTCNDRPKPEPVADPVESIVQDAPVVDVEEPESPEAEVELLESVAIEEMAPASMLDENEELASEPMEAPAPAEEPEHEHEHEPQAQPQPEHEPVEEPAPVEEPEPQPEPESNPDPELKLEPESEPEPQLVPYHEPSKPEESKFGNGFILGLLTGLAIGAVGLLIYILFQPMPGADEEIEAEEVNTEAISDPAGGFAD